MVAWMVLVLLLMRIPMGTPTTCHNLHPYYLSSTRTHGHRYVPYLQEHNALDFSHGDENLAQS
jgi:hypothetical protein